MEQEVILRRLVIKVFNINKVEFSDRTYIDNQVLYIRKHTLADIFNNEDMDGKELIEKIDLNIINPNERHKFVNSIMDFSPIAAKVLGTLGEGITHVLTGVQVMLTGVEQCGIQVAEFGSSEGFLDEKVVFGRRGTPDEDDIIVHIDVTLKNGQATNRPGPMAAHRLCDIIIQEIRNYLKKINGRYCDEKHEYFDKIRPGKKKVIIVKQVAGQGCMYDTGLFAKEPGGHIGCKSIIDMGNMPVVVSPNEYRDGILRSMN
ncbi:proline reductase cluster protein PrdD [Clostridium sp. Marseille-Q2269]|uniref:proline reductase cluster protein PrdD n=1 Tax=Clostridium sp. Marseille-Q2269 TaxID=2942205 RepID=UPI002073432D|nr:proline reductase cluster protein PrdD [Clostridium sp. Marseille-Q2269]